MGENEIYSQDDVKQLYERYIFPITQKTKGRKKIIGNIKSICIAMDLLFTEKQDSVWFGEDVYSTLKRFHINQAGFLKGELELVSFYQALELIGTGTSINNFGWKSSDERRKGHWREFIRTIPIQMYYGLQFYFFKEDVIRFVGSVVSVKEFHVALVEQYNKKVSLDRLRRVLNKEYTKHMITFIGAENYYYKRILEEVAIRFPRDMKGYFTTSEASELLGLREVYLKLFIGKKDVFAGVLKEGGTYHFPIAEVEKWKQFQNENLDLWELVVDLMKKKGIKVKKPYSDNSSFVRLLNFLLKKKDASEFEITNGEKTPFPNVKYFIHEKYYSKLVMLCDGYWHRKSLIIDEGDVGKFKVSVEDIDCLNAPVTIKEFYDFAINRITNLKKVNPRMMTSIYEILSNIKKELFEHNDEEIERLLELMKRTITNRSAFSDFCIFLKRIQGKYNASFNNIYKYNKHELIKAKRDVSAYSEEQYFRFGFLLLNDTHEWYEGYLEKALSRRIYASVWLYGLLHYVCAWRSVDMVERLPRPTLPISALNFINLIRKKKFTEDMAKKIVDEVEMKVRYLQIKPTKTEKHNPPNLFFEIPESIKFRLGMLLGLCEAHRQIADGNFLLSTDSKQPKHQIVFFGPEFVDIFGGKRFNNIKANRTFEILMAQKADEEEIGTGYIIASVSRSHKCISKQKSNTTAIYLNNYRTLTKSDILMRELFERGVCSFVPYLVLKTLESQGKIEVMSLSQQTKAMKELVSYHPYDVEMLIAVSEEVLEKAKVDTMSLIDSFSSDKEAIYKFLNRIACGTAPAKEKNMNCISVAKGGGCIYPERKTCIGCGQEIYLKSSLFVIGQRLREMVTKLQNGKTVTEKNKYRMLIDRLFKPVLMEMMMVLRDIHGVEDVSEYQKVVFEIGKTPSEVK